MKDTSPFPGMDPYLEDPTEWSTVHARLINSIADQLTERVGSDYRVKIEQRVYILTPDDQRNQIVVPDVFVVRHPAPAAPQAGVAQITLPTLVEPLFDMEVRERYIDIVDAYHRKVVTTLEILSPFNKRQRTPGRDAFLQKRRAIMRSDVHWIEIDLLRAGERPPEVAGRSDYYALLKRGDSPGPYEVWYSLLRDRLPIIAVPLRPPAKDVPLDLQAAIDDVYRRGRYAQELSYTGDPPPPPLRAEDRTWLAEQMKEWS